jgi:hypothetical protein
MARTMAEVRKQNAALGERWFSPETLRCFRCEVGPTLVADRWFWTSEQSAADSVRAWTVREALPNGRIATVGDFMGYETKEDAVQAIGDLVRVEVRCGPAHRLAPGKPSCACGKKQR